MTKEEAAREKALDENILGMYRAQLAREETRKDRKLAAAAKRHQEALADYKSEEEINEAWGYGLISTRKRDSLIKAFRETKEVDRDLDGFIEWLRREIVNLGYQIREMDAIVKGEIT